MKTALGKGLEALIPDKGEEEDGHKLAAKLGWRGRVAKCHWPDDEKDINGVWQKYPEMITSMIRT